MPPLSRAAFVRALRGLSRRELAAFVADLWSARGYETAVRGDVVLAERDGERLRLGVRHDAGWLGRFAIGPSADDLDAVVTSGSGDRSDHERIVDTDELREVALYAIDRTACERLFRRHLGRPPTADADRRTLRPTTAGAVAVVAVALVVLAGAGGFGPATGPPGNGTPAAAEATTTATTDEGTPAPEVSGFESADRLARAHANAVEGRSRYWSITFEARRDGLVVTRKRQSVWFQEDTVYLVRTEWWSREGIGPAYRGNATTYADGDVAFERFREGEATIYSRQPVDRESPPFAAQPAELIRRYLDVDGPRVVSATSVDDALGYHVVATGTILSNATRATTTAELSRAGVLRELRTEYRSFGGLTVVVSFGLDGLGATTARPPPWLERARNETAAG